MTEFVFRGSVTLHGATFYISAPTREKAIELASKGKHDDCEFNGAEMVDWDINPDTIKENT